MLPLEDHDRVVGMAREDLSRRRAHLFDDPAAYRDGVQDAIAVWTELLKRGRGRLSGVPFVDEA